MKTKQILRWLITASFLLALTACNLPTGSGGGSNGATPDINGTVAAKVAIAQAADTMVAQTLTAAAPISNAQGNLPTETATNTIEVPPELTFTPTLTPTITLTPTPEGVTLVVSADTYCRFGGPYSSFKILATVKAGQVVEVLARNPENDSYYVKNPYEANSTCWMYGKYATLTGNAGALPISTMHPTPTHTLTPTPKINFTVSYVKLETCMGDFAFKLYVKNIGGNIWEYEQITGADTVTGFVINHSSNTFKEWAGCAPGLVQNDLAPGEESYLLNIDPGQFGYDPTGNKISIAVKLCTQDGGGGTCLSKDLTFTP